MGVPRCPPLRGWWSAQSTSEESRRYRPLLLDVEDVDDVEDEVDVVELDVYAADLTAVPCFLTQVVISEFVPWPPSVLTMM